MVAICSWFHVSTLIGLQMRALLKKLFKKVIFSAWDLLPFSEKCQKTPDFEQVPLQNHWTYNVL